jgi:hypothetical protein
VISGGWDFDAGKFVGKQVDFVNQDREALRADVFFFAIEGQLEQRGLRVGAVAVETSWFGHEILQTMK